MLVDRHERGEGDDRHLITSDEFDEIWTLELDPVSAKRGSALLPNGLSRK
jgi:hypothetical protein